MRCLGRFVTAFAVLASSLSLTSLRADDREAASPVPTRANASPDSEVYRASEVIGLNVNDENGQQVGKIKDLVINGASREVLYAVVALNDATEKDVVYVMPWSVFQPYFGQNSVLQYTVITVPQTVWVQAPYWSMAQWRQVHFNQWAPRVDRHFANFIHVNSNRNSTFRTNKPALKDEQGGAAPRSDQRKNENIPGRLPQTSDQPGSTDRQKPKAEESPKRSDKPDGKQVEQPGGKTPQLPAPRDPDPADPKGPPPKPRDGKPAPKNPK